MFDDEDVLHRLYLRDGGLRVRERVDLDLDLERDRNRERERERDRGDLDLDLDLDRDLDLDFVLDCLLCVTERRAPSRAPSELDRPGLRRPPCAMTSGLAKGFANFNAGF
jgi:hypothetical protein